MKFFWFCLVAVSLALFGCATAGDLLSGEEHGEPLKKYMTGYYCTSPNTEEERTVLGYLEERDDVDKKWLPFIVCQYKNLNTGEISLRIFQKDTGGAGLTLEQATQKAAQAMEDGKEYFTIGIPYTPKGELDAKRIEYRIYQQNGEPVAVEVFVIMRDEQRQGKEPKTLRVSWPAPA